MPAVKVRRAKREPQVVSTTDQATANRLGEELRDQRAAVRFMRSNRLLGCMRQWSVEQTEIAARALEAKAAEVKGKKKLIDPKEHPAAKNVGDILNRARAYWVAMTTPFPEKGVRLLPRSHVHLFEQQMQIFQEELDMAVRALGISFAEVKQKAKERLLGLYDDEDYPEDLDREFSIDFDYVNVDPPKYLMQMAPELYQRETARAEAKWSQAVVMAETVFREEFAKIISHLREKLTGQEKKVIRSSAIENLKEFFEQFKLLSVRSDKQLDDLVAKAKQLVSGLEISDLKSSDSLRDQVAKELVKIETALEPFLVKAPKRKIQVGALAKD